MTATQALDNRIMPQDPAREFTRLVEIMATLRGPHGCPWDREQTFESLTHFVLEEAYEVVDAIERGDREALREEIDKLVRRHPHVFRDDGRVHDAESRERAPSAGAALARWDAQKAAE